MPNFRKGAEEIQASVDAQGSGGNFRPFVPSIFWSNKKEEYKSRYVLILTNIDEVVRVETVGFIPVEDSQMTEMVIARTDPAIGEKVDPLVRDWDAPLQESNILVGVELEAITEVVKGRPKPKGFEVKTKEYTRRVRDDDGELTDESETVVTPIIGVIVQRPSNFGNLLAAYDAENAPIDETPLKITRNDTTPMTFSIQGYEDMDLDLDNLLEYVDGISYLNDEMDDLIETLGEFDANPEGDLAAAHHIGAVLLAKRLEELCDEERYQELYDGVTESLAYNDGKGKGKGKPAAKKTRERPARASQRKPKEEEPEVEADAPEETPEEAPVKKTRKTRATTPKAKAEAATAVADPPKEKVDKLQVLRDRAARNKAKNAESE